MKKLAFTAPLLVLLAAAGISGAAFEELELGVADQAMGGSGVLGWTCGSLLSNPAASAGASGWQAAAASRLPFTAMDLATHGLDASFPLAGAWRGGLSLRYFGFPDYNEQLAAFTASGMLGRGLSAGVQPVFARVGIADGVSEYGSATAVSLNFGLRAEVYGRWVFAASIHNPLEVRLGESDERLERRMDIGAAYMPAAGMESRFSVSRDFRGLRLHAGQAVPVGPVSLMAGVQTDPVSLSGGFGATVGGVSFEYALQTHPDLAPTHQAGAAYAF